MSWQEIDLTGVSTDMEMVPEGMYVFSLLAGAKPGKFDPEKIELGAKIAEGEYAGRVVYFSYGNPDKVPAMIGAFKRLEIALARSTGVSIQEGEQPVSYLNNEQVVNGKFLGTVRHRVRPATEDREAQNLTDMNVFKVKPLPGTPDA
jgi:hypothetical protein